uniref:Small ribosomal subunit protein uS8c n=1 Tax=Rhizochromulina marina TaxID=1034831 RepID=A0A514CPU7_9STRA|nr:ribosomal protein S8 [Rhizochromulina marina]QDH81828.1 ribosomal protein S8 [Rhizochromulina marina]
MVNDTISDMLTRIRNATNAKHHLVQVPLTKMTKSIAEILKNEGFIDDFEIIPGTVEDSLVISLKYNGQKRKPVITKLQRVSKPGVRVYAGSRTLPVILNHLGIAIISTSQGVMTDSQARKLKIGGEVLCYVW